MKLPKIKIDRGYRCRLDKDGLPDDLVFKGQEEVVIQDLIILTNISPVNGQAVTHFFTRKKATFTGAVLPGASDYVQIDDTGARVNGTHQYCQVVCSPLFTAYFTTPSKGRLSVLSVLTDFMPPRYFYNQQAKLLPDTCKLADKARVAIDALLPSDVVMGESEFKVNLDLINTLGSPNISQASLL